MKRLKIALQAAWAILWGRTVVVNALFINGQLHIKSGMCVDSTFVGTPVVVEMEIRKSS